MIAPLYVERPVIAQHIHDQMCARAAVVYVAEYMKLVDAQFLDHVAYRHYERVGLPRGDDSVYDTVEIILFVVVGGRLVKKLLDDIGILLRQSLAHFRTRVFRRHRAADGRELIERHTIEIGQRRFLALDKFEFPLGIIYERTQTTDFRFAERVAECLGHLATYIARGIPQYMMEGLVFAVQIGHEMLRPLGKT